MSEKKESKMIMIRKLNKDNGLQDWKTEHQAVTGGIFYCRGSAGFSVSASNKLSCNLTVNLFETPNVSYTPNVSGNSMTTQHKSNKDSEIKDNLISEYLNSINFVQWADLCSEKKYRSV